MFIKQSQRRAYIPEWSKRRPRADTLSYAMATIRLGISDMVPAIWSFVKNDFSEEASDDAVLAAEWLSLFLGDEELTNHSPLLPLGWHAQWDRLNELGLLTERELGRGLTTKGMARSTWDLLFLAAITPQSLSGLRAVREGGWQRSEDPVPLSRATRALGKALSREDWPGPLPHELVLAGLHLAGHKIRFFQNGAEPLVYVSVPGGPDGGDELAPRLPSLLDDGWTSPIPQGVVTDIGLEGRDDSDTTHFHIFNAAAQLARVDRGLTSDWAPIDMTGFEALQGPDDLRIANLPFNREGSASGLSGLISSGRIRLGQLSPAPSDHVAPASRSRVKAKAMTPTPETTFTDILTIMGEGWFRELGEHQDNSHSFSNRPLFPYEGDDRVAELLGILSLDGFALSQARLRVDPLMDPELFEDRISDHADREGKTEINALLHMRRGSIGDPLSRLWQSLCLMNPDRSVEEIGVEDHSSSSGNPRITRLKIDGRLFMSERLPVMNMLSLAERAGCRGFVSVGESFTGAELLPGSSIMSNLTLSLTCVEAASALTLSHDLFGRFDRTAKHVTGPDGPNP